MVEYASQLDTMFASLADATRRDILKRVATAELTVNEIAQPYDMSLAAVSKHLQILEKAKLVHKRKKGKERMVSLAPQAFKDAHDYLEWYQQLWEQRIDALDTYLQVN